MAIRKLLVANRGEIAVRIIRAAKELGIKTVAVHSLADADSLAVKLADEAVPIGPPAAAKSYLKIDAILEAARLTGADAVHPGYGFLAENADFADAVEAAGMVWVGPKGDSIRVMGDKVAARIAAEAAGVPVVPGSDGRIDDPDQARAVALAIGFPVMIKAAAGGGGRGIRIAHDMEEFERLMPQASAEAKAAFGDGGLYMEKVIERARHIEVQVLGDGTRAVHFFERECSLQRRRQKVWEEAPSATLPQAMREKLCASAVALAEAVGLHLDAGDDRAQVEAEVAAVVRPGAPAAHRQGVVSRAVSRSGSCRRLVRTRHHGTRSLRARVREYPVAPRLPSVSAVAEAGGFDEHP